MVACDEPSDAVNNSARNIAKVASEGIHMTSSSSTCSARDRVASFAFAEEEVRRLDRAGATALDVEMYRAYQRRNCFGLDRAMKIYRIFQETHYHDDLKNGCLTLPRADANVWGSQLENPLASVKQIDQVTGQAVHLGSAVQSFFALCWTSREYPTQDDWDAFSHGKATVRIETTVGKLLDRAMCHRDPSYMHRSWVIDADYRPGGTIRAMQTPEEVMRRLETTGSMLALSAATIQTSFSDEDEVRFLFDDGIPPQISTILSRDLIQLPFDWSGFADSVDRHK